MSMTPTRYSTVCKLYVVSSRSMKNREPLGARLRCTLTPTPETCCCRWQGRHSLCVLSHSRSVEEDVTQMQKVKAMFSAFLLMIDAARQRAARSPSDLVHRQAAGQSMCRPVLCRQPGRARGCLPRLRAAPSRPTCPRRPWQRSPPRPTQPRQTSTWSVLVALTAWLRQAVAARKAVGRECPSRWSPPSLPARAAASESSPEPHGRPSRQPPPQ